MTGWGDKHHRPIAYPRGSRRTDSILCISPDDQGEQYRIVRFYSDLVSDLLSNEIFLVLLLAFLLSVLPFLFL